ncbi:hypothetical protein CYY_001523 [Polysphondylium violaceum]|uniref:ILEI/PANDER domain-containing protein n=1 Tax=Polysphondylium violaceum TaxID=133409 RepID=A0A8J4VAJ1_9MYCE|nr:hypothetical protein CYY_001523 [Polysphondylium violaceum]
MNTELILTLNKLTYNGTDFIYYGTTFNIFTYTAKQEPPFSYESYEIHNDDDAQPMLDYINSIPPSVMVLVAIHDAPYISANMRMCFESIGSVLIYDYIPMSHENLMMVGAKGMALGTCKEVFSTSISYTINQSIFKYPKYIEYNSGPGVSINGTKMYQTYQTGLNIMIMDDDFEIQNYASFNIYTTPNGIPINGEQQDSFYEFIDSIKPESLVSIQTLGWGLYGSDIQSIKTLLIQKFSCRYLDQWFSNSSSNYMFLGKAGSAPFLESCSQLTGAVAIIGRYYRPYTFSPVRISTFSNSTSNVALVGCSISTPSEIIKSTVNGFLLSIIDDVTGAFIKSYEVVASGTPTGYQINTSQAAAIIQNEVSSGSFVVFTSSMLPSNYTLPDNLNVSLRICGSNLSHIFNANKGSYSIIGRKGSPPGSVPEFMSPKSISLCSSFGLEKTYIKPYLEFKVQSRGFLSSTNTGYAYFYINSVQVPFQYSRGFNVGIVNENTGDMESIKIYDTSGSASEGTRLVNDLKALSNGKIVLLAVCDDCQRNLSSQDANEINSLLSCVNATSSTTLYRSCFALVAQKGMNNCCELMIYPNGKDATVYKRFPVKNTYVGVTPAPIYKNIRISYDNQIVIDNNYYTNMIDGFNVYSIPSNVNRPTPIQALTATTLYQYISALQYGDIVIVTANTAIPYNQKATTALFMIGMSKYNFGLDPANVAVQYSIIGRKGSGLGSAMEWYSTSTVGMLMSSTEPVFTTSAFIDQSYGYFVNNLLFCNNNNAQGMNNEPFQCNGYQYMEQPGLGIFVTDETVFKPATKTRMVKINVLLAGLNYYTWLPEQQLLGSTYIRQHRSAILAYLKRLYPNTPNNPTFYRIKLYAHYDIPFIENTTVLAILGQYPSGTLFKDNLLSLSTELDQGDVMYTCFAGHSDGPFVPGPNDSRFMCFLDQSNTTLSQDLPASGVQTILSALPPTVNNTFYLFCCNAEVLIRRPNATLPLAGFEAQAFASCPWSLPGQIAPLDFMNTFLRQLTLPNASYSQIFSYLLDQLEDFQGMNIPLNSMMDSDFVFLSQVVQPALDLNSDNGEKSFSSIQNTNSFKQCIEFKIANILKNILDVNPSIKIQDVDFGKILAILTNLTQNTLCDSSRIYNVGPNNRNKIMLSDGESIDHGHCYGNYLDQDVRTKK